MTISWLLLPFLWTTPTLAQDLTIKVGGFDGNIPLEVSSGWPLNIQLYANGPVYLADGKPTDPQVFIAEFGQPFAQFVPPRGQVSPKKYASLLFPDGKSVQFIPGLLPPTPVNNPPQLLTSRGLIDLPPLTGGNYGASPNLPGLVILTDVGTGLVFDQNFNLAIPLEQRNVAGFVNSILYTLSSGAASSNPAGQVVMTAQVAVPPQLFVPVVEVDDNVGPINANDPCYRSAGICSTSTWMWRIDGGKLSTGSPDDLANTLDSHKATNIRIFMVNGKAPDSLMDLNGDGVVDSADARLAGYEVISNEISIQFHPFRQNQGEPYFGFSDAGFRCWNTKTFEGTVRTDLDSNSLVTNSLIYIGSLCNDEGRCFSCSSSSIRITPVPR